MELKEFSSKFYELAERCNLKLNDDMIYKFYEYMNLLLEWNEKINLTAITNQDEIIIKHFIDSLTVANKIKADSYVIDIGTGAGFPGIPLKIYNETLNVTLLDSLNKRTIFLQEVVNKLNLKNIKVIHGRAEDFARDKQFREKYDYSISRAVAPLNILVEYLVPYVKVGGKVIAMKGSNAEEEILEAKNAMNILKANLEDKEEIELPQDSGNRYILVLKKQKVTENKYPRKAGMPKKSPL